MTCKRCGYDETAAVVSTDPCWMYQIVNGEVKSQLFDDPRKIPEGWYDSPPAAKKALEEAKQTKPKKADGNRLKQTKSVKAEDNDNSTGTDK